MHTCTYIHTYIHAYIHTYICTYIERIRAYFLCCCTWQYLLETQPLLARVSLQLIFSDIMQEWTVTITTRGILGEVYGKMPA